MSSLSMLAQKVTVQIVTWDRDDLSQWQILNMENEIVYSNTEYSDNDTVTFSLDANKRYLLHINVCEINSPGRVLYTLILDGEPVILVNSGIDPGEHLFPFFTGIRNIDNKIIGGTNALIADFPWQVYYISGNYLCGGSIISEDWILTAAHCTMNSQGNPIPAASMSVKVGATNPADVNEGEVYSVSQVIVNEDFDSQTLENDIALLKVAQPVNYPNARAIKLVTSEDVAYGATDPGVMAWVTGWGLTHLNPDVYATNLQKVQLPVVSNAQAATVWNNIPPSDIMAGYLNGNKDACNGDSGGPLVVPVFDEYKLGGIVSWGSSNCNTYGAYMRVSAFETWIRSKTGIVKEYRPPAPEGDTLICEGVTSGQYSIGSLPGATVYEWNLLPAAAGVAAGNSENATVSWDAGFTGSATLIVRVTINNVVSEWSRLNLKVLRNTKLLSQSGDTTLCAGQPVILYAGAEGYNLVYNWFRNGQFDRSTSTGQLQISSTVTDDSGDYKCEITGYCGSQYTNTIKLTVHPITKIISVSPDMEIGFGEDGILEANVEGYDLEYQWKKDDVPIENSNTDRLMLYNMNANDIGLYHTSVLGTCGSATTDLVYVYVKKADYSGEPEVFLWPSVTSSQVNVALSNDDEYNILIFNSMGEIQRKISNCRYETSIDISSFPRGVYLLNVYNKSFRRSLKLIKK